MPRPGRSARRVTRVPMGVRWMSRPPNPARRVSFIRYSLRRTRRTFSTMMRLSFRSTFDSAGTHATSSRTISRLTVSWFHGLLRPYARAIVSILYSTVYPSFVIRSSLQRHELRRARRADARSAVDHGLAGHRELAEEMADHLGLDLHRHELLPVVDRDLLPNEVGQDRDVAAVRPDRGVGPVRA